MNPETKNCQNCKQEFTIEPDDFAFYDKIFGSSLPAGRQAPTWCPACRMQRRMMWRNERNLYKRICGLTGKNIVSCFSEDSQIKVYDRDAWWSDKWDPFAYGKNYDFTKPFFKQFRELIETVPLPALFNSRCVNSDYCNHSGELKNGYLVFASWGGEDIMYSKQAHNCKDCLDILASYNSNLCYETVNSEKISNSAFVENSENCFNCYFVYNCRGCNDCFGCTNLRNKSYCIFNSQHTKEDYLKKIQEFRLGSYQAISNIKKTFDEIKSKSIRRFARSFNVVNSTGDNLTNVSNCKYCFDVTDDVKDSKYCVNAATHSSDCYDGFGIGVNSELLYEAVDVGDNGSRLAFDIFVWGGSNVSYCYGCHRSQNMFGCIGLHKQQYCILNKQYTKEEYEVLRPKIIQHMNDMPYVDGAGRSFKYGEFFPPELSPFAYNETIAQEYFPLTKEQALSGGFRWRDPEVKSYTVTVDHDKLPDDIKDTSETITNEVISCGHVGTCNHQCTTAFKIISRELEFYRKMNLPLPRICSNCRHYERLKLRNPLKLWHRACMCDKVSHGHDGKCGNEFETSYSPDRPEIVYCEKCYQQEVV
jgi:hypothetical protein